MNTTISVIDDALEQFTAHAQELALLRLEEQKLEDERHVVKRAVVSRLMQTDNPETAKQHSASSAENWRR